MALLLIIRYVLSKENKRRDREQLDDSYDDVYIERIGKDGQVERVKVDKVNSFVFNFYVYGVMMRILTGLFCKCFYLFRNFWILLIFRIAILDMFCNVGGEIL